MDEQVLTEKTLFSYFSDIKDPRSAQGKRHIFFDMVCLAICAVLCGADSWVGVENFGNAQLLWFQSFLELSQGIPSHDAFSDLFQRIDPKQFQEAFTAWAQGIAETLDQAIVSIDGKTVRKSFNSEKGIKAMHSVSAFSTANRLILGQVKTQEKSNEITAIPELLKLLLLKGCIVTIDAIGCQTTIAEEIIENGADYVLAVKENQRTTLDELENCFEQAEKINFEGVIARQETSIEKDHGRLEKRTVQAISSHYCQSLTLKWHQIKSIVRVIREREVKEKRTCEVAYYISSLVYDHPKLLKAPRAHWGIENSMHWILDMAFREDDCRIREKYSAENFAIIRRLTLNLLQRDSSKKVGIAIKRQIAG